MKRISPFSISIASLFLIIGLAGCTGGTSLKPEIKSSAPGAVSQTPGAVPRKGISLSPRSFQADDFNAFFSQARQAGLFVSWAGDWAELNKPGSAPSVVTELSRLSSYSPNDPVIELQVFMQSTGKLLRPLDKANRQSYVDSAVSFAAKYKPLYLGIGIEVNILNEKAPADFDAFVTLFDETSDAVKAASPDTKVFTVFQFEKMKGLNGGIFGGVNDPGQNQWNLLERFNKADLFAFTTYPGLVFKTPFEIPADYYSEIRKHTEKPVAFSEIGWQTGPVSTDWPGSEAMQSDFIKRFFMLSAGLKPEFDIWSFLYDQPVVKPFDTMGLFGPDGIAKQSWNTWLEAGRQ